MLVLIRSRSLILQYSLSARLQVTTPLPPLDACAVTYFNSLALRVTIDRHCSVESQLGKVAASILNTRELLVGSTKYVPNAAMLFETTALFSSGVPSLRLPEANFARPAPTIVNMKRP